VQSEFPQIFHSTEHVKLLRKVILAADAVFDCGANIGFATIFFKWLFPKARIYAFEPDPATYALLEKNVKTNKFLIQD
jgi:tRNA1(Val) A37 N6-methylase TrmN6